MSSEELVFSLLVAIIGASLGVLGSIFIDWKRARRDVAIEQALRRVRGEYRRWVTVLIPVRSNSAAVTLLGQLAKNRYTHFDVVLVDERGDAEQAKQLRLHVAGRHFRVTARVLIRRQKSSSIELLNAAYKKSLRGEVTIVLPDTARVDRLFVKRAVAEYNISDDRKSDTARARVARIHTLPPPSHPTNLELSKLISGLRRRLYSFEPSILAGSWRNVIREYETVHSNRTFYKGMVAIVLISAVLVSIRLGMELDALWYIWLFAFGYCLAAIWSAPFAAAPLRLQYSSIASVALFLIPIHSIFSGAFQLASRK